MTFCKPLEQKQLGENRVKREGGGGRYATFARNKLDVSVDDSLRVCEADLLRGRETVGRKLNKVHCTR